ncbi:hypothetical protein GCM10022222_40220 [Amycolatopsis ultiminotia]|uniref:Helix-turn-helix domain-containing protein n=1 Tax=Amycolatopsis ultiminotia TaxID=543629 RepID=A0ABP6WMU5_9PSEU
MHAANSDTYTLFSIEAAAQRLSIGRTTMYGLIRAGDIETIRIGRLRRVSASAIAEYIAKITAAQTAA